MRYPDLGQTFGVSTRFLTENHRWDRNQIEFLKGVVTMKSTRLLSQVAEARKSAEDVSGEKHYSISELAELWNLSENTIRRMFENEPDVLQWGGVECRFKRRYRTIRIPERVVLRVHRQLRVAG